jgi:hypothetical protein
MSLQPKLIVRYSPLEFNAAEEPAPPSRVVWFDIPDCDQPVGNDAVTNGPECEEGKAATCEYNWLTQYIEEKTNTFQINLRL